MNESYLPTGQQNIGAQNQQFGISPEMQSRLAEGKVNQQAYYVQEGQQ